ncbi:MAG TPA: ABC transporter ATP-binding protein [Gemmatimonadaceae bacterium]|nr:ABC transporter ATP-binding protein [Gemmatimonadaceae bacterium]
MREAAAAAGAGDTLSLRNVTRRFGTHAAVDDVSLDVAPGELLALVGASGSGKTTTLRIAAGYEQPDSGSVLIGERDITALPPQKRSFGMVFQHYALFPHMSVEQNVAFGLEARGVPKKTRLERARSALERVGLGGAGERPVQSLSGGEQQRVAVARALVIEPRALLLDEPLSNLDPVLRQSMRDDLSALLRHANVPALLVTHDQEDAFAIADRVALLSRGRILQNGSPAELYNNPASLDVARFIGRGAVFPCSMTGDRAVVTVDGRALSFPVLNASAPASNRLHAILRPEHLEMTGSGASDAWPGVVLARRFAGSSVMYRVELAPETVVEVSGGDDRAGIGSRVGVRPRGAPVPVVGE